MNIQGIQKGLGSIGSIDPNKDNSKVKESVKLDKSSFADVLGNTMKEVNQLQLTAEDKIESFVLGRGAITPHNAMIALEKADVAFQLMNTIRSKIIRAYEEVMRTQV